MNESLDSSSTFLPMTDNSMTTFSLLEIRLKRPSGFESCIQQRKTTGLLSIRKSLACARASKFTTTKHIYIYDIFVCLHEFHSFTTNTNTNKMTRWYQFVYAKKSEYMPVHWFYDSKRKLWELYSCLMIWYLWPYYVQFILSVASGKVINTITAYWVYRWCMWNIVHWVCVLKRRTTYSLCLWLIPFSPDAR